MKNPETPLTIQSAVRYCFDCKAHQCCTAVGGIMVTCDVCKGEDVDANQESMPDPMNSEWTEVSASVS